MVSLLTNSYGNRVITDGNLNNTHSNIKKFIQSFAEPKIDILNNVLSLRNNYGFKEKNGDLLSTFHNTKQFQDILENRGYVKTTSERYPYENVNHIYEKRELKFYEKNHEPFIKSIILNDHGIEKEYSFFVENNYILFYSTEENNVDFYYHLNDDYKIKDFKINTNKFAFLIVEHEGKTKFLISHLGKYFIELNKENQDINYEQCFNCIDLEDMAIQTLQYTNYNKYYFLRDDLEIIEYEFDKKYYFEQNEKYYFHSNDPEIIEYEGYNLGIEQVEFLNIYNYINFLGLNDFKIDDIFKISTKDLNLFNELLVNKFDNTLNGGINYFNAKEVGTGRNILSENLTIKKDYHVNIKDEYFKISGNFMVNNYEKGNYKIEITENTASLLKCTEDNFICIKTIQIPSLKEFYFCNLKFNFKKFEFPPLTYTFNISSFDTYPYIHKIVKNYKVDKIPNNKKVSDAIITNARITSLNNRIVNGVFDGSKIIFYNFFDYKNKAFKYANRSINVSANTKINISEIKAYIFDKQAIVKDSFIYFRDSGTFYYTNVEEISFELINVKGYITDFWINNQGKTLYFKNYNENIMISDSMKDCDYYCTLPNISEYIDRSEKTFGRVQIEENDDMELEKEFSEKILITNKIFNEPLFYKFHINNCDSLYDFHLCDHNHNEVYTYISETFQDGITIYFNAEKDKRYYYNLKDNKFNYIEPMLAYENVELMHYFDENGIIKFNPRMIKSFKLKCSKVGFNDKVSIYLYNTIKGEAHRLELSAQELNEKFELDLEIDKMQIEVSSADFEDFIFIEDSGTSLRVNNKITFFKTNREDIIYISEYNTAIDEANIEFNKIKVNTKYVISNKKAIEDSNGTFSVHNPVSNEIPIFYYDHFKYYETDIFMHSSIFEDEFYNNNFKNPGSFYINNYNEIKKISETSNELLEISELKK